MYPYRGKEDQSCQQEKIEHPRTGNSGSCDLRLGKAGEGMNDVTSTQKDL